MSRVRAIQISLAAFIVLALSFSGLRAAQAWSESSAHAGLVSARSETYGAIRSARTAGVPATDLTTATAAAGRLDRQTAPASTPLWDTNGAAFYTRQARAYRAITRKVVRTQTIDTRKARSAAAGALTSMQSEIRNASSLYLDVSSAQVALTQARERIAGIEANRTKATPAAYTAVTAQLKAPLARLSSSVSTRTAAARSLAASVNDSTSAVAARADVEAAASNERLQLLSLLAPRASGYQKQVAAALAAVHAQKTAFDAAVQEAHLRDVIALADADFAKTMPAKMVVVSTEDQMARMYQAGQEVFSSPVTTGGPELPTDHGVFHIYAKFPDFTFHSPWPPGSPYYYLPSFVQYWMPFDGGEGLHDASWRTNFGPGSNLEETDLGTGNYILGTHGCVNLPTPAAAWLWNWAPVGTTVVVI